LADALALALPLPFEVAGLAAVSRAAAARSRVFVMALRAAGFVTWP
jgi:hypothetical protein